MSGKTKLMDLWVQSAQVLTTQSPILITIYTILVLVITAAIYQIFFVPFNRIRDLSDVGYQHLKNEAKRRGKKVADIVNYVRSVQKIGQVPPVYPNGWFAILESHELKVGEVKSVYAIGESFAVFRSKDGKSYVLDAHCSHLGANLAVGGRIIGSCIECPFHGWQFDGNSGNCVNVPYADKVPANSKVRKWHSVEMTGWIFVWFNAENEEPSWYPPVINQVESGEWVFKGRTEHYVRSHIQDIPENGGDIAHLPQVHSPSMFAGIDLRYTRAKVWEFGQHVWQASWKECEPPNAHIAELELTHNMKLFGKIPLFQLNLKALQIGPALVYLESQFKSGKGVLVQTVTPISPLELRLVHRFYTEKSMSTFYCKIILLGEATMLERDIMVWNSKRYVSNPILVKEDRLLARHRRWYSQFYSENSPRLLSTKDTADW